MFWSHPKPCAKNIVAGPSPVTWTLFRRWRSMDIGSRYRRHPGGRPFHLSPHRAQTHGLRAFPSGSGSIERDEPVGVLDLLGDEPRHPIVAKGLTLVAADERSEANA